MNLTLRKALYWVGILLGVSLFLNQAWRGFQSFSSKSIAIASPVGLLISAGFIIGAMGIQIATWRMMMANLNVRLSWREVLEGYILSFLPRYIPGSVWGYVSRAEWLKQNHNTPYLISNLGSIVEVTLIFMGISLVAGIYLFQATIGNIRWILLALFCSLPLIVWGAIQWGMTSSHLKNFYKKYPLSDLVKIFPLWLWLELSALHGIAWTLYGASVYWVIKSISPNTTLALVDTTFLFAISWLLGFIVPFVPSGFGVREQSLSTLLTSGFYLSPGLASGVAVLSRLLTISGEMVWLLAGLLIKKFRINS